MIRQISILILFLMSVVAAKADPRWKIHTTFDGEIDYMFETPKYVYFTSRAMPDMDGERRMSLFRYDKEGDELQALSTDNVLTSTSVSMVQYNPKKGYVVAVNNNFDLTFIYDDGKVLTMPDYRLANINNEKTVNSITIDPWHDRIYLATAFGYVSVNDQRYEIAESRDYGESLKSVARIGEYIVILKDADLLSAKAVSPRLSLTDYETKGFGTPFYCAPLSEKKGVVVNYGGERHRIVILEDTGIELTSGNLHTGTYETYSNTKDGLLVTTRSSLLKVDADENVTEIIRPDSDYGLNAASYDLLEIWQGKQRGGIKSSKRGDTPDEWQITRDYMMPSSPSPFVMPEMVAHPSMGVMVPAYGYDYTFMNYPQTQPLLLSGYKDGWWTNYSPAYVNDKLTNIMVSTNGIAVDPDNPDYVYLTSPRNGIIRLNLRDSEDVIHMSKPADKDNGNPWFVEVVPNQVGPNSWACNFSAPKFDSDGNMWMAYADYDTQTPSRAVLYCWEAPDRKATTNADNIILPKRVEELGPDVSNRFGLFTLTHRNNKNKLIYSSRMYDGSFAIIDTNGTPTDNADDEVNLISSFTDQDNNNVDISNARIFWEDSSTGYVWVGHTNGVCYFNPSDFTNGKSGNFTRIKVSRNDGTNLADYLLDGVVVNNITTDGKGRKWFGTSGGGIVVTSSDGRTIEEEITTDNSPIPSDNVYGMMYIPSTNSMLIATSEGIAEYYLSSDASASGDGDLKIYPNPVRPDYFGYVTIEGLPDRSLVKIVDASGNIVKEMGPVSGDVKWDVTNHQYKRVSSGVYFVLASVGENEGSYSSVGKILVVN